MGRPRKPRAQKILEGTYRKDRDNGLPEMPPGAPPMPPGLSDAARKEWALVVPDLLALGTLTKVDGGTLATYCRQVAIVAALQAEVEARPMVERPMYGPTVSPALVHVPKACAALLECAKALGLNHRARHGAPAPAQSKKEDPAETFMFGGAPRLEVVNGGRAAPDVEAAPIG